MTMGNVGRDWTEISLAEFLEQAGAAQASPASGAAAAVAGAIACSMAQMAVRLTLPKLQHAAARNDMQVHLVRLRRIERSFERLYAEDAVAVEQFMQAWRLPKDAPNKRAAMAEARARAVAVPAEMVATAVELLQGVEAMLPRYNPNLMAEVATAAILAEGAARAAGCNIAFHLSRTDLDGEAKSQDERLTRQLRQAEQIRRNVEDRARRQMRENH